MRQVTIVNCDSTMIMGDCVGVAETKVERVKGLLGTQCLPCGHGLLLRPCSGVHTFGMRYAIDVIFLDEEYRVIEIVHDMRPMRIARCYTGSMVLELPTGTAEKTCTQVGHRLMEYGGDAVLP